MASGNHKILKADSKINNASRKRSRASISTQEKASKIPKVYFVYTIMLFSISQLLRVKDVNPGGARPPECIYIAPPPENMPLPDLEFLRKTSNGGEGEGENSINGGTIGNSSDQRSM
jgi:hypothetical protein